MNLTTTTTTTNDSEEVLIERRITFRNSTFGALKSYIRAHEKRTGQKLSNAAAVDMLLRQQLVGHVHRDVILTMQKASRPQSMQRLQEVPEGEAGEATTADQAPRKPLIDVDVSKPRPWLTRGVAACLGTP